MGLGLDMQEKSASSLAEIYGDINLDPFFPLNLVAGVRTEFSLEPINDLMAETVSLPTLDPSRECAIVEVSPLALCSI